MCLKNKLCLFLLRRSACDRCRKKETCVERQQRIEALVYINRDIKRLDNVIKRIEYNEKAIEEGRIMDIKPIEPLKLEILKKR